MNKVSFYYRLRRLMVLAVIIVAIPILLVSFWLLKQYIEVEKELPSLMVGYDLMLTDPNNPKFQSEKYRSLISYQDIPAALTKTLVAVEDPNFYMHNGVDFDYMAKNIINGQTHGHMTLTMALARNICSQIGRQSRTRRTVKMFFLLPLVLEKHYNKSQILTLYLNHVNFYGNQYGIEAASQTLFGCKTADLQIQQIALLIGMLKGQGVYNPYKRVESATQRRNFVLSIMAKNEIYPTQWLDSLQKLPLGIVPFVEEIP